MRIRAHYYAYSKFKCPRQPLRPLSGIYLGVTRAVWDTHFFVKLVYMHAREKKIVAFLKNYRFHREKMQEQSMKSTNLVFLVISMWNPF